MVNGPAFVVSETLVLDHCWVSGEKQGLHEHHVVPRSYGGTNGPTVTVCATIHNLIHTVASSFYKEILSKGPSIIPLVMNYNTQYESNANAKGLLKYQEEINKLCYLIYTIVKARALSSKLNKNKTVTFSTLFDSQTSKKLKRLCKSTGYTQDNMVKACIDSVYQTRFSKEN